MQKVTYKKHNSFFSFKGKHTDILKSTTDRIIKVKKARLGLDLLSASHQKLLDRALNDLLKKTEKKTGQYFNLLKMC